MVISTTIGLLWRCPLWIRLDTNIPREGFIHTLAYDVQNSNPSIGIGAGPGLIPSTYILSSGHTLQNILG